MKGGSILLYWSSHVQRQVQYAALLKALLSELPIENNGYSPHGKKEQKQ
jgi:hypothetical protein